RPTVTQVRSGEAKLTALTGAKRPPTGTKTATGNVPFRGLGDRTGRPAKESRKTAEARKAAEARAAARVRRGR
ncbi:MAG: RNA helicase, partial [Streptomyces sp.]|nr:RNA helicase [Streptomyces sp.]NUS79579.1 RNA helicase [Streptomyces sp.]